MASMLRHSGKFCTEVINVMLTWKILRHIVMKLFHLEEVVPSLKDVAPSLHKMGHRHSVSLMRHGIHDESRML